MSPPIERGRQPHLLSFRYFRVLKILVYFLQVAGRTDQAAGKDAAVTAVNDQVPQLVSAR
jgi:hypothetical protein